MGVIPMMGMVALMMLERYVQNLQSNRFNDKCLNFTENFGSKAPSFTTAFS